MLPPPASGIETRSVLISIGAPPGSRVHAAVQMSAEARLGEHGGLVLRELAQARASPRPRVRRLRASSR